MRIQFFLRRGIFFFVCLCSGKVVSEQTAARSFEKPTCLQSIARDADVERLAFSAVKRLKNLINRSGETEAARQIVRRAERQNCERNPGVEKLPCRFVYRSVASGCNNEIHWFFECLLPAAHF